MNDPRRGNPRNGSPAAETTPLDLASPSQDRGDTVQAVATLEEQVARMPHGVVLR